MSDNIFNERFAGYRQPGWHNLGTVFDDLKIASDAMKLARLDYQTSLQPIIVEVTTLFGTEIVRVADQMMIVRDKTEDDPEFRTFGVVSPNYQLIQNTEIGEILDPISEQWPVETVGALGYGERIFITLKCPSFDVKGDQIDGYFLVTNGSDGKRALQIAFTPVRVVCQNTLVMGLARARASAVIRHYSDAKQEFDARVKLLEELTNIQMMTGDLFNKLSDVAITSDDALSIFRAAYPEPKKTKLLASVGDTDLGEDVPEFFRNKIENHRGRFETMDNHNAKCREGAMFLYNKINDEFPAIAGTPWAAYNAVVECSDFRDGHQDSVDYSTIFGVRANEKQRAFKRAIEFVEAR